MIAFVGLGLFTILLLLVVAGLGALIYQGRRKPNGHPQYVALGSSFAAGIGLGPRAPDSPLICMRSTNGYPQQLARNLGLSLVDMTCSGATALHILHGGQMFLGPQLDALDETTQLVTMTIGGNDIRYVGDLSMLAARKSRSIRGLFLRMFWKGPVAPEQRKYAELEVRLTAILREIKRRAPSAKIVVITYPAILPPNDICADLCITDAEAAEMRIVGDRLADISRATTQAAGAILVDMVVLGAEHHACSEIPWVNGWTNAAGTQFHPTLQGAAAVADAIEAALADRAG